MLPLTTLVGAAGLMLSTLSSSAASTHQEVELWAGHQITYGSRKIPFKGRVTTRTDTWVLAEVDRSDNGLTLRQRACRVTFAKVGGVTVSMRADRLPANRFSFAGVPGRPYAGESKVYWDQEDVDDDGNPGATVTVDAPVCSGDLYVSNASTTRARAAFDGSGISFRGRARVSVEQSVLGAKGACLNVVAKDTQEVVQGPFAYVPVRSGTTCRELLRRGWPVEAEEE